MLTRLRSRMPRLRDDRGVTLIELALVILLLTITAGAAFNFLFATQRHEARISNATQQDQAARTGMERVARALREARYPQGMDYTNSAIFEAGGTLDTTFYSDANNDDLAERTRIYLVGTTLYKSYVVPNCTTTPCGYPGAAVATKIIDDVKNGIATACGRTSTKPMFTYYKKIAGGGSQEANPGANINEIVDIFQVKITLQVQKSSVNAPACQTLETTVQLRNWRNK
jgi:type II secretory pathway pseudopilin PulG